MNEYKIAVIPGDGIGKEVVRGIVWLGDADREATPRVFGKCG